MNACTQVFVTTWCAVRARRVGIRSTELCRLARECASGLSVRLGARLFKKRLHGNQHRAIIVGAGGGRWVYVFLFAKHDQADLTTPELVAFRKLSKHYARLSTTQWAALVDAGDLREIDCGRQVQEHRV
ncbi:MAG: type II toxin-antitoxin system RelE/ParE family toxin [Gemmatimonadota bacterium]|nr:type II toxin-antitoxin system RelE/ParE family toxin [Gemmatimonadota bacterium]